MNPRPISVKPLPEMHLLVLFSNGEQRVFDVQRYIESIPALNALNDPSVFTKAHIAHHTVAWSDLEDICPDTLYLDSQPLQKAA